MRVHGRHFKLPPLSGRNRGPFPKARAVGQGRGVRLGWPRAVPRSPWVGLATLLGGLRPPNGEEAALPTRRRRDRRPAGRPAGLRAVEEPLRFPAGPLHLRKEGLTLPSSPPTAAPLR